MNLGDIRVVLMVLAVVGIVYFLYNRNDNSAISNEGSLDYDTEDIDNVEDIDEYPDEQYDSELERKLNRRRNSVPKGAGYKEISYRDTNRNQYGSWEDNFDRGNSVIPAGENANDTFSPVDEASGNYAPFRSSGDVSCNAGEDCEPEDLFNADKLLPQEVNDDWYQVLPEPVSVKNRHLINVTRPIGVNTIGNSKRNSSHDIRGTIPNPKTVVSPFLNSSIEPDFNIRPNFC